MQTAVQERPYPRLGKSGGRFPKFFVPVITQLCTMPTPCTLHQLGILCRVCTLYAVYYYTPYTLHLNLCSVQCAVCSMQCIVRRMHCSVQCAVCSVQSAVCDVQCAVCSV